MICKYCGKDKPMTVEHWKLDKRSSTGFRRGMCRDCFNAQQKKKYEDTLKDGSFSEYVCRWEDGTMRGVIADLYRRNFEGHLYEIRRHLGIK